MADPVTTMTLLKMAGLDLGLRGLGGFLSGRDKKRQERRQERQAKMERMIASLSPQRQPGQQAVTPMQRSTASIIADQFNQDRVDPLLMRLLDKGVEGLGGLFDGFSFPKGKSTYIPHDLTNIRRR